MCDYIIRPITPSDNPKIAKIIRDNLERFHLDIPGTVYFDEGLDSLSDYYFALPEKRKYFIITDANGLVTGGVGIAEFEGFDSCAELQKLYLADEAKGKGLSKKLMQTAEEFARKAGYKQLYLETHTNLETAIRLYERLGFIGIDRPTFVLHSTMNRFYLKTL
ncbi:MAG: GNAT family N-acetyltransferase [Oscillospiraceae bacterium]